MNTQGEAHDDLSVRAMIARQQREMQELRASIGKDQRNLHREVVTLTETATSLTREAKKVREIASYLWKAGQREGTAIEALSRQTQAQKAMMSQAVETFRKESEKAADRLRKERWRMSATSVYFTATVMVLIILAMTVLAPGWSMTPAQRQAHDFGADILEVWWEMPDQERAEIESTILREVLRQGKLHLLD